MIGKRFVSIAVVVLFLLPAYVRAGTEPSPFHEAINQLEAASNILVSINDKIVKVLACPPDDMMPCPDVNGAVGRLSAKERQLYLVEGMVTSIVDDVLSTPPDDMHPDIIPALDGVLEVSQLVTSNIDAYLGTPPDDMVPQDFLDALEAARGASQYVTETALYYRETILNDDCVPSDALTQEGCENAGCTWIIEDPTTPVYDWCCCPVTP